MNNKIITKFGFRLAWIFTLISEGALAPADSLSSFIPHTSLNLVR